MSVYLCAIERYSKALSETWFFSLVSCTIACCNCFIRLYLLTDESEGEYSIPHPQTILNGENIPQYNYVDFFFGIFPIFAQTAAPLTNNIRRISYVHVLLFYGDGFLTFVLPRPPTRSFETIFSYKNCVHSAASLTKRANRQRHRLLLSFTWTIVAYYSFVRTYLLKQFYRKMLKIRFFNPQSSDQFSFRRH